MDLNFRALKSIAYILFIPSNKCVYIVICSICVTLSVSNHNRQNKSWIRVIFHGVYSMCVITQVRMSNGCVPYVQIDLILRSNSGFIIMTTLRLKKPATLIFVQILAHVNIEGNQFFSLPRETSKIPSQRPVMRTMFQNRGDSKSQIPFCSCAFT